MIRVSKKLPKNSRRRKRPLRLSREGTVCGCALGSEIKWNLEGVQREDTGTLRMVQRGKEYLQRKETDIHIVVQGVRIGTEKNCRTKS